MASLKNSLGEYCREQNQFKMQNQYTHYKYSQVPVESKLPGLGINVGNMRGGYYNNVLSNNATEIESNLYGIRQIDLTQPKSHINPKLNKLYEQSFFKTPKSANLIPEPLVIRKFQRPIGPFSGV